MILPFLRLLCIPNTESKPPGDADDGVGKQVGRGKRVTRQLGRLDLGLNGREIARLPPNSTAILLIHSVASAKDNGLSALELIHGHLFVPIQDAAQEMGSIGKLTENKEQEDAQRPLPTIATFLGSNNPSAGGSMEKGWHS